MGGRGNLLLQLEAVQFWELLETARRRKDKDAWSHNPYRKGIREIRFGKGRPEGCTMCSLQAGKTGKQKSNAAALHTIPWTAQQPGLGSGKSVIYNLKSGSPNRKITACQCKWWCLQGPASLLEQLLTTTCQGMGMTRRKQAVLPGGMGDFSGLQVLDSPLSRMLRHPAVLSRSAAPGTLMEETQFLLKTRKSVKNEVNAVSTGGEKGAREQLPKNQDQILALKRGSGKKLTP